MSAHDTVLPKREIELTEAVYEEAAAKLARDLEDQGVTVPVDAYDTAVGIINLVLTHLENTSQANDDAENVRLIVARAKKQFEIHDSRAHLGTEHNPHVATDAAIAEVLEYVLTGVV